MLSTPKVFFNGIAFNSKFFKTTSKTTTSILGKTTASTTSTVSKIKGK